MKIGRKTQDRGMTLMEAVISLGVVGLVIPLILSAVGVSLDSSRKAREDTRAAMMARGIFAEVPYLWGDDDEGLYFGLSGPSESYPEFADRWLTFDAEGNFLKSISAGDGQKGVSDNEAFYAVMVEGEEHEEGDTRVLSKVIVQVQAPAQAAQDRRRTYTFVRLFN